MKDMLNRIFPFIFGIILIARVDADPLEVADSKGRAISIDLLSFAEDKVTFTVPGKGDHEYELALATFDEASREKIIEASKSLKPRIPKLEIEASIGKRRKKTGYYMVRQTVTAKLTFSNPSHSLSFPGAKARLLFIGRNRRDDSVFSVLKVQEFDLPPIAATKSREIEAKPVVTNYDSDNAGYGNAGGFQYDAYIVGLLGEEGQILGFKTSDPGIRSAIGEEPAFIGKVIAYQEGTRFDKNLEALDAAELP